MAGLIVKSPYLKCGGGNSVSGHLRYIGTKEQVEIFPDDRLPTRKQEQLIRKLVKDLPSSKELSEYSDYEIKPAKAHASAFITRTLERNWSPIQQSDGYKKYIATRPGAERLGDHGLFGDEDGVDLAKAMDELDHYTGNVWPHILSLKRENAARLGYNNARARQNSLWANRSDIAATMNISPIICTGTPPSTTRVSICAHDGVVHGARRGRSYQRGHLQNQIETDQPDFQFPYNLYSKKCMRDGVQRNWWTIEKLNDPQE